MFTPIPTEYCSPSLVRWARKALKAPEARALGGQIAGPQLPTARLTPGSVPDLNQLAASLVRDATNGDRDQPPAEDGKDSGA